MDPKAKYFAVRFGDGDSPSVVEDAVRKTDKERKTFQHSNRGQIVTEKVKEQIGTTTVVRGVNDRFIHRERSISLSLSLSLYLTTNVSCMKSQNNFYYKIYSCCLDGRETGTLTGKRYDNSCEKILTILAY